MRHKYLSSGLSLVILLSPARGQHLMFLTLMDVKA